MIGLADGREKAMAGRQQLTEEEALAIVLRDHPQWRQEWHNGTLPDEVIGDNGEPMSPRMHITVHTIVERQLSADDPPGVVEIARKLKRLGVSRHDIRHEIGRAVVSQIWQIQTKGGAFDEGQYPAELEEIVDSHRRGSV